MANSTSIKYDRVSDYVNKCNSMTSSVESLPKASQNSAFQILESLGLCNGFAAEFDSKVSSLGSNLSLLAGSCENYLGDLKGQDEQVSNAFDPPKGGGTQSGSQNQGSSNGNQGSGSSGGQSNDQGNDSGRNTGNDTGRERFGDYGSELENGLDRGNQEKNVEISSHYQSLFNSISDDDFDVLISVLQNISESENISLEELFEDKYKDLIQEALLENANLSQGFKDLLYDASSSVSVVDQLKNLVDGKINKFENNEVMTSTLIDYLELYAQDNNLTLEELIEVDDNFDILKQGLEEFTKVGEVVEVVNQESIQQKLLDIYEGKSGSSTLTTAIQSFVNNVSDKSNVEPGELLKNEEYSEKVYNVTGDLNEASKAVNALSSCSSGQIIDTLRKISASKTEKGNGE